jgi:DNA polymerase elongation subunit (family B)
MSTPVYGLDIETDTTVDGLDPATSPVTAVAVATADADHVLVGDEPDVLAELEQVLSRLRPGLLVTWNGSGFDLPFLAARSRLAGVPLSLELWADPSLARRPGPGRDTATARYRGRWFGHRHLDGYRLYRADVGRTLGLSCGLKPLSRLVGLDPVEVDRSRMHLLGDEALRAYVASDARLARELVMRRLPAAACFADRLPDGARCQRAVPD